MAGAEFSEFLLFGRQLGLALAGAAALWGFVFSVQTKHKKTGQECLVYEWLGIKLFVPLAAGALLALLSWLALSGMNVAQAHEGIVLTPPGMLSAQNQAAGPFLGAWLALFLLGFAWKRLAPASFFHYAEWRFALHFLFASFLMALFVWEGQASRHQLFYLGHTLHSIFTLGTVLVLDFLFLLSRSSVALKQHVYPLFPTLSKVILVGLGIDFLSVALVFPEAIALTPKFFFMQTVIAIVIINGTLLAGPLARRMMASVRQGGKALTRPWETIGGAAGVVSAGSWLTNTFVDFFEGLAFTYAQLLALYLAFLITLYLGHLVVERLHKEAPAFLTP